MGVAHRTMISEHTRVRHIRPVHILCLLHTLFDDPRILQQKYRFTIDLYQIRRKQKKILPKNVHRKAVPQTQRYTIVVIKIINFSTVVTNISIFAFII